MNADRVHAFREGFRQGVLANARAVGSDDYEDGFVSGIRAIAEATARFRREIEAPTTDDATNDVVDLERVT
jgi:hypothetical protein